MTTGVVARTREVATGKLAIVAPAGTITRPGTLTEVGLSLERVTTRPPAGAGPLRVMVPASERLPTSTSAPSETEARALGMSVRVLAGHEEPPISSIPVIDTLVSSVTAAVMAEKVVRVAPSG